MPMQSLDRVEPFGAGGRDGALILASSWEKRCLGVPERLCRDYAAQRVLLTVYDGQSERREVHTGELLSSLAGHGPVEVLSAMHRNPIMNANATVAALQTAGVDPNDGVTVDVTCFTRRHLLQLLQALDLAGYLAKARFLYSQPTDYYTGENAPVSKGVASVRTVLGFAGRNRPSRDSMLILFVSFEGRRGQAMWEHLEPNRIVVVIPDPPYRPEWKGRAEEQNRFLLSSIPQESVKSAHFGDPQDTVRLLRSIVFEDGAGGERYNYRIGALGTKAQVLGMYRFWRDAPFLATVMYAQPMRYAEKQGQQDVAEVFSLDESSSW
jgi:hypothetical protein